MDKEQKRPPWRNGGRKATIYPGRNIKAEYIETLADLQAFRVAYLSRRHRLAPTFAAAVATFVYAEGRP